MSDTSCGRSPWRRRRSLAVTGSPSRVSSKGRSSSGCWPDCRSRSTGPGRRVHARRATWTRTSSTSTPTHRLELDAGRALLSNVEDGSFGRRPADVAVDPTLGAEADPRPDTPAALLLRGSRYAPLRFAVSSLRGRGQIREVATRVLVVMGGTDPHALSPRAVAAVAGTGLALTVTVVAPKSRHADCRRAASGSPGVQLELLSEAADLPARMLEQDLVVSAAGTSVWELCCLGLPMALVCAVDNQKPGYDRVVEAGAAAGLGERLQDLDGAAKALRALLVDAPARVGLADRASAVVDGRGAWRIVGAWEQLRSGVPRACQRSGGRDAPRDGRGRRAAARLAQRPGRSAGVTDHRSDPVRRPRALARADAGQRRPPAPHRVGRARRRRERPLGPAERERVGGVDHGRAVAPWHGDGTPSSGSGRTRSAVARPAAGALPGRRPGEQRGVSGPVHEIGVRPRSPDRRSTGSSFSQSSWPPVSLTRA